MNSSQFGQSLILPDTWQRRALNFIREGRDVVLHAPTGAGKTFVFEQLIMSGWKGRAVYTVPTRALANDKFRDWKDRGWDIGLVTGDVRYRSNAQIVVATLETQRGTMSKRTAPDLLVVDEYQLLGDGRRGPGYEVTIALAPLHTRLLLLSGSVANPVEVSDWLRSHGRCVELVSEGKRPVPLDEVFAENLLRRPFGGRKIRGHWPKLVAGALSANLGPLLIFAPRRAVAEELARQLASELPPVDLLQLSQAQKKVVGKELTSLLRRRVAYHHSGLDYMKRAGVVEPLAKAGQLQVVVATTGLGAGVNFSMRSVLVTDREYRVDDHLGLLRPDELLQMFGRAGRRGMDDRGYVIVAPKQARLSDARPLRLHRSKTLDWAAIIRSMSISVKEDKDPIQAARWLARRLFSEDQVKLGFDIALGNLPDQQESEENENSIGDRDEVVEMRNSVGLWERRSGRSQAKLGDALALSKGEWVNPLSLPETLSKLNMGNPCRFGNRENRMYGRELSLGLYGENEQGLTQKVTLIKSFRKRLREVTADQDSKIRKKFSRKVWRRRGLEQIFCEILPMISQGGELVEFVDRGKTLRVRLSYENASVLGWKDARGKVLLNPPMRTVSRVYDSPFRKNENKAQDLNNLSPSEVWFELGLIDRKACPTLRGEIFSFFSIVVWLAIAAAVEDENYPLDELILDLANLRAGHRFRTYANSESRLAMVCRETYGLRDCEGYLKGGLPEEYGEGAMEVMRNRKNISDWRDTDGELRTGDLERVEIEWKSLVSLIAYAPELDFNRWTQLQKVAREVIGKTVISEELPKLPELPGRQRERFESTGKGAGLS